MKRLPAVVAASLLCLLASGCKNKCLELAQMICECQPTTTERDTCNQQASDQGSKVQVSPTDEQRCADLMSAPPPNNCDCHALDTPEGKLRCGMARPADWK